VTDEVSRRLDEAAGLHARAAQEAVDVSVVAASVIGKARRRRRITASLTVAGAFAGLIAFAGGSFAVITALRPETGADARPAAPVEVSQAPTVHLKSSPAPDQAATIQDYPPVAASRGAGFPDAYEMRDWVWDYVGKGWSLESFAASADPSFAAPLTLQDAVIYLVSPDGAAFELAALAPKYSVGLRVVSWQENARTAHIEWDGDSKGVASGGAELDLATGRVLPLVFATPWGQSGTVKALAVSVTGNELWQAWLGTHQRFYRYGTKDGWTVASINDLQGIGDRTSPSRWDTAMAVDDPRVVTRPDSAAVLFEQRPERGGPLEQIVVYNVDTGGQVAGNLLFDFPIGPNTVCTMAGWAGDSELSYDCGGRQASFFTVVPVAGMHDGAKYGDSVSPAPRWGVSKTGVVGYGLATSVSYLAQP
jgi:hypothetical protein